MAMLPRLLGIRHLWTEFQFNQDPRGERSNNRAPWRKCQCFCLFNNQYPLLWASLVTQMVNNLPAMQGPRLDPWSFIMGIPGGASDKRLRLPMQEMQLQSLGWEDPLKKEMATSSSILAWEMPWTEELVDYSPSSRKHLDTIEHTHTFCIIFTFLSLSLPDVYLRFFLFATPSQMKSTVLEASILYTKPLLGPLHLPSRQTLLTPHLGWPWRSPPQVSTSWVFSSLSPPPVPVRLDLYTALIALLHAYKFWAMCVAPQLF